MRENPPCTKQALLRYLSLEAPGGDKLKPEDLIYLGCVNEPHGAVWYWRFKCDFEITGYAYAEHYRDGALMGWTETRPEGLEPLN